VNFSILKGIIRSGNEKASELNSEALIERLRPLKNSYKATIRGLDPKDFRRKSWGYL
jgi:hypothetical protein